MELAPGQAAITDDDELKKQADVIAKAAAAEAIKAATEAAKNKLAADALVKKKAAELKAAQEKAAKIQAKELKEAQETAAILESSKATADDLIFDDDLDDFDFDDIDFGDTDPGELTSQELYVNKAALHIQEKQKLAEIVKLKDQKNDALVLDDMELVDSLTIKLKALNLEHYELTDEIEKVSEQLSETALESVNDTPELLAERLALVKKGKVKFETETQKEYEKLKEKYSALFDENPDFLEDTGKLYETVNNDYPTILRTMQSWQGDTNSSGPMGFRIKALQMEGKNVDDMVWRNEALKNDATKAADKITDAEYLSMRALNQAYMEKSGITKVELFRGTDGRTGESMANQMAIDRMDTIDVKDRPVGGYTDAPDVADNFGFSKDGVSMRVGVAREDIIIHKGLFSGVTNQFKAEHEYIIFSSPKLKINTTDIMIPGKPYGRGWVE